MELKGFSVRSIGDKFEKQKLFMQRIIFEESLFSSSAEFQCAHGSRCIPPEQVCDGQNDCQDRSDEMDCQRVTEGCHHLCDNNTRCIPETFLCDGEKDCADGSDEEKCGRRCQIFTCVEMKASI